MIKYIDCLNCEYYEKFIEVYVRTVNANYSSDGEGHISEECWGGKTHEGLKIKIINRQKYIDNCSLEKENK